VVNAPQAGLSRTSLIVWFTPGIAGGVATAIWTRYYKRRFAGRVASRSMPNAQSPMLNAQRASTFNA
jgi:hypothetical protein